MSLRNAIAASGTAPVLICAIGSGLWVNTGDVFKAESWPMTSAAGSFS